MSIHFGVLRNGKSGVTKYVNDFIIQPAQFLLKQETQQLKSKNEELKRNNEDLAYRIEQMMMEFNFDSPSFSEPQGVMNFTDSGFQYTNVTFPTSEFANKRLKKNSNDQKFYIRNKCHRPEKTDMSILRVVQGTKDKTLETSQTFLKPRSLNSQSSSGRSSPIYLDIYDSECKAYKNRNENRKRKESEEIYNKNKENFHSEHSINGNKEKTNASLQFLSNPLAGNNYNVNISREIEEEIVKLNNSLNEKFIELNSNFNKVVLSDQTDRTQNEDTPTANFLDVSESQKTIINIISKNSDILASIYEQQLNLLKNNNSENGKTILNPNSVSLKSESCQTNIKQSDKATSINKGQLTQSSHANGLVFQKINEQSTKIEGMDEKLSLLIMKTKKPRDLDYNANSNYVTIDPQSIINDQNLSSKEQYYAHSSSLEFDMNDNLMTTEESLNPQSATNIEFIGPVYTEIAQIKNDIIPENLQLCMQTNVEEESANKNDDNVKKNSRKSSNFSPKRSSKIPVKKDSKKANPVDNSEQNISNALESSYETLYDNFTGRSQDIDENTVTL